MANVVLKDLTKNFKSVVAVNNVSLEIKDKEFLVLVALPAAARRPRCGWSPALRK